jgi:hypothetical protein
MKNMKSFGYLVVSLGLTHANQHSCFWWNFKKLDMKWYLLGLVPKLQPQYTPLSSPIGLTGYVMPRSNPSSYTASKDDRKGYENYENDVFGIFIYF